MTCFCVYGKIDHVTNYCKLGLRQVAASLNFIRLLRVVFSSQ